LAGRLGAVLGLPRGGAVHGKPLVAINPDEAHRKGHLQPRT